MAENAFQKLAGGDEFLTEFFEYLLSKEEVEFLLLLPRSGLPLTFGELVEKSGMTEARVEQMLETLIHKTMVIDLGAKVSEDRLYGLASPVAWIESYFYRYIDLNAPNQLDIHVRLGQWWEAVKNADRPSSDTPNLGRLIPIETAITDTRGVIPTSEASKIVDEADYIAVMRCPCRSSGHLAGNACDSPLEACFSMNAYARYQVKYGFAREVTKERAKQTLRECEERGLPHVTDNVRGNYNMLCNCCSCHCIALVGLAKSDQSGAKAPFLCSVDPDACTASGDCAEKCEYDAISVVEARARVDEERCIGCGACTTVCPTEALSLKVRPPEKMEKYYESLKEYYAEIPAEAIDGDIERAEYIH